MSIPERLSLRRRALSSSARDARQAALSLLQAPLWRAPQALQTPGGAASLAQPCGSEGSPGEPAFAKSLLAATSRDTAEVGLPRRLAISANALPSPGIVSMTARPGESSRPFPFATSASLRLRPAGAGLTETVARGASHVTATRCGDMRRCVQRCVCKSILGDQRRRTYSPIRSMIFSSSCRE